MTQKFSDEEVIELRNSAREGALVLFGVRKNQTIIKAVRGETYKYLNDVCAPIPEFDANHFSPGRPVLSEEDVNEIKKVLKNNDYRGVVTALAKRFKVDHSVISRIRHGHIHKNNGQLYKSE